MRWCRIRLLLLGLLLCVVHVVSGACGQRFTDTASSAVLSDVVIEGKVRKTQGEPLGEKFNISVTIRKQVLRGAHLVGNNATHLTIGQFSTQGKDLKNCVGSVKKGRTYFFFLKDTKDPEGLYFEILTMPVPRSKTVAAEIRNIVCKKCAKSPTIQKLTGPDSLLAGSKVTLKCAAEAKPNPEFSWFKDNQPVVKKGRVRIKSRKRQSTLQINNVTLSDSGNYTCMASNAVGETMETFTMKVSNYSHYEHCTTQTFCLNGGTCYVIKEIRLEACKCPEQWAGRRCELLDAISVRGDYSHQATLMYERTLVLVGIVLALLVFVVICIASYVLAKNRRKQFEQRQKKRQARQAAEKKKSQVSVTQANLQTKTSECIGRNTNAALVQRDVQHFTQTNLSMCPVSKQAPIRSSSQAKEQDDLTNPDDKGPVSSAETRRKLAASSVYENLGDPEQASEIDDRADDSTDYYNAASTVCSDRLDNDILGEDSEKQMDTYDFEQDDSVSNRQDVVDGVGYTNSRIPVTGLTAQNLWATKLSSSSSYPSRVGQAPSHFMQTYSQSLEPVAPLNSLPNSCSQPTLPSQLPHINISTSEDNSSSKDSPGLNHFRHDLTEYCRQPLHVHESSSDADIPQYSVNSSRQHNHMHPNLSHSGSDLKKDSGCRNMPHSNTFPKTKVGGLATNPYSDSDEEFEAEIPYEKQLHISEEELGLSEETLDDSSFLSVNLPAGQLSREEWVVGLLPHSSLTRLGMRKYQSEEGPAYNKLVHHSLALLQDGGRSRSLDAPPPGDDSSNNARSESARLNSTMAGSPDIDIFDNFLQQRGTQLCGSSCGFDPNDDSAPWQEDIDISAFTEEEGDKLRDLVPDQQPIPI